MLGLWLGVCIGKWVAAGRRFPHGEADTNIPVENLWKLVKYTMLDRRVNLRAGYLLDRLVGIPGDPQAAAQSVVDYYRRRLHDDILYTCRGVKHFFVDLHGIHNLSEFYLKGCTFAGHNQ